MRTDSDEIFDVVDEHDRVVGQARREEVHARGLRHRAVHVLVFNARGQVFLQKRSAHKDTFPGAWDSSAAGHVGRGEDYDACAVRELEEELALRVIRPPARLFKIAACPQTGQEFVWVYRVEAEGPFEWPPEEIETGAWFDPREIDRWVRERPQDFASGFVKLWRILRKRAGE